MGSQYNLINAGTASAGAKVGGERLTFTVRASDINGFSPVKSFSGAPVNASYIDKQTGTATFSWLTTANDVATYNVKFIATDGNLATPGSDSKTIKITVTAKPGSGTGSSTLNKKANFDPLMPVLLLFFSILYLLQRKRYKFLIKN